MVRSTDRTCQRLMATWWSGIWTQDWLCPKTIIFFWILTLVLSSVAGIRGSVGPVSVNSTLALSVSSLLEKVWGKTGNISLYKCPPALSESARAALWGLYNLHTVQSWGQYVWSLGVLCDLAKELWENTPIFLYTATHTHTYTHTPHTPFLPPVRLWLGPLELFLEAGRGLVASNFWKSGVKDERVLKKGENCTCDHYLFFVAAERGLINFVSPVFKLEPSQNSCFDFYCCSGSLYLDSSSEVWWLVFERWVSDSQHWGKL